MGAKPTSLNYGFRLTPSVGWGLVLMAAIGLSLYQGGVFQPTLINPGGWPLLKQFWLASLRPDFSPYILLITLKASLITLAYAVCGTALSLLIGLVGGLLTSEVWWAVVFPRQSWIQASGFWLGIRGLLAIPRAIHELVWGLFLINLFGLDPLVGILAIALPYSTIVAKVFSEILDESPRQPLLVLLNSGVPPLPAFVYGLLPLAFLDLLSYSFYRFECSLRSATVLGMIGAGGLGYEILLSLQSLRYEQLWTFFLALFVLIGLVDMVSAGLRQRLGCATRLDLNLKKRSHSLGQGLPSQAGATDGQHSQAYPTYPRDPIVGLAIVAGLGLISFSFFFVQADFTKLWSSRTLNLLFDMGQRLFPPDFGEIKSLFSLSIQTIAMSILASAGAGLGGLLLAFPAAHNFVLPGGLLNVGRHDRGHQFWSWIVLLASRSLLLVCRAIPAPVWALVVLLGMFPGVLPGAIALGIHNLGILGRLKAESLENLDQRPLLALKAQGAPAASIFLYGVLPLTIPRFIAYDLYRWEVCIRETVIVGFVGAGGLGRLLTEQLSSFDYPQVGVTLACLVFLTFLVDVVSGAARRSIRG